MSDELSNRIHQRLAVAPVYANRWQLHWESLTEHPLDLSPWESWLLLCLVRHRGRQQYVLESMESQLDGDPERLAERGWFGHPDRPHIGLVPGDTQWEYRFHGRGCCMTHRVTGEEIDVDFLDDTADWITRFFFVNYLESLRQPAFVESRVRELYPTPETVNVGIDSLIERGLLEAGEYGGVFRLCLDWRDLCELLDEIDNRWDQTGCRTLTAAALSDWLQLSLVDARFQEQADQCRQRMNQNLSERFRQDRRGAEALKLLADLDADNLIPCLEQSLQFPPSGIVSAALEIIEVELDPREWVSPLQSIVDSIDPNGDAPAPHIWITAAKMLVRIGTPGFDAESAFLQVNRHSLGEACLFAMESDFDCAMTLIRRGLRSDIPINRIEVAAALAIIDLPWCHSELASVLAETTDQERTTECRTALLESRTPEVQQIALDWETRHPHVVAEDALLTVGELAQQRNDAIVQYEMQSLHDRIHPLRPRFQPPPSS